MDRWMYDDGVHRILIRSCWTNIFIWFQGRARDWDGLQCVARLLLLSPLQWVLFCQSANSGDGECRRSLSCVWLGQEYVAYRGGVHYGCDLWVSGSDRWDMAWPQIGVRFYLSTGIDVDRQSVKTSFVDIFGMSECAGKRRKWVREMCLWWMVVEKEWKNSTKYTTDMTLWLTCARGRWAWQCHTKRSESGEVLFTRKWGDGVHMVVGYMVRLGNHFGWFLWCVLYSFL